MLFDLIGDLKLKKIMFTFVFYYQDNFYKWILA